MPRKRSESPPLSAREHYHREKDRRAGRPRDESAAMAAARREYKALLESNVAAGKRGRPRKKQPNPPDEGMEND